ncbi:hypothetical protein ACFOZY_09465 [Chungangia koreensis]|uniref:Transcriptional regulator n=1 Tax=Chungangia koreensis TaxID=752657 RepID=A0ABV8X676_9LACT
MLEVEMMKPFYITQEDHSMKLIFDYEYFSIRKGEEVFEFIPAEGKEIVINVNTYQVENLGDIFVFQNGNRFIRLPLYQLLLISDIHNHLQTIMQQIEVDWKDPDVTWTKEAENLIVQLEKENFERLLDRSLIEGDRTLFMQLTAYLKEHDVGGIEVE